MIHVVVRVDLDADERLVLWTLGAVGRPMWRSDLEALLPRGFELDGPLVVLRRLGLVRGWMPIDLTGEGMRRAAKLGVGHEASLRRELRQLDRLDALAEAAPSP